MIQRITTDFFIIFIVYDVSFVVEKDLLQFIEFLPSVQSLSVAILRSISIFIFSYFFKNKKIIIN